MSPALPPALRRLRPNPTALSILSLAATTLAAAQAAESRGPAPEGARTLWADLNGDGRADLYAIAPGRADVLLVNHGAGRFVDATDELGLAGRASRRALAADLDGDGRTDLLLVGRDGRLVLRRGAAGAFLDETALAGLDRVAGVRAAEPVDGDGAGPLDLWVDTAAGPRLLLARAGGGAYEIVELPLAPLPVPNATSVPRDLPAAPGPAGSPPPRPGDAPAVGAVRAERNLDPTPGGTAAAGSVTCAPGLVDAAGGCLGASSDPVLGMLYPLSPDLFVDSFGRVGVGTVTPNHPLTVAGSARITGELNAEADVRADADVFVGEQLIVGTGTILSGDGGTGSTMTGDLQVLDDLTISGTGTFGVRIGVGTSVPQHDLHVRRTGDAVLHLEADFDNFQETDHPQIRLTQDGGVVESQIGVGLEGSGNDLVVQNLYEFSDIELRVVDGRAYEFVNTSVSGAPVDVEARLTGNGNWEIDGSVSSPAADLAEFYPVAEPVEPGDVVAFAPGGDGSLQLARGTDRARLAGVVSTRPAFVMGLSYTEEDPSLRAPGRPDGGRPLADRPFADRPFADRALGPADPSVLHEIRANRRAPLALAGRVPCKVTDENGPIRPGDLLAPSPTEPGHAARAVSTGPVIGTALEPWSTGRGRILVLVRAGWFTPDVSAELAALRNELEDLRRALASGDS